MKQHDAQALPDVAVPDLPASAVTDTRAAVRGKLINRRRTAVVAAIVVAALGAALTVGLLLDPAKPHRAADKQIDGSRFDPLRRTLRVGWLPPGLTATWNIGGAVQQFEGREPMGRKGDGLLVDVWARGVPIPKDRFLGLDLEERPTAPINGHAAWCLAPKGAAGSCQSLKWQYAPDSWAFVFYAGTLGPDEGSTAAVARRVAESVSLTADVPVRLPFRLSGQAAKLYVLETMVGEPSDTAKKPWAAGLTLTDGKGGSYGANVLITVHGAPDRLDKDGPANTTVDGQQARRDDNSLVVWGVHGTRLSIAVQDRPWNPQDYYGDIQWSHDPADYRSWPVYR
jgi:hypothetical protein